MKIAFLNFSEFFRISALALGLGLQIQVFAGNEQGVPTPILPALPADVAELKFRDFFVMPVGPRGLEMNARVLALAGRHVRIVGYMAQQEAPHPGFFMLTPVPVNVAEASDGMADDLPPATLFVHLPSAQADTVVAHQSGLLAVTGMLSVGARNEADGRISMVRLQLDEPAGTQAQTSR